MRLKSYLAMGVLSLAVLAAGCAAKPAGENASEVIQKSKLQQTVEAQGQFLVDQAKAFVASKSYQEAVNVANYVVKNFKDKAPEAQKILEDAKAKLQAMLDEQAAAAKKEMEKAATDLNNKVSSWGK